MSEFTLNCPHCGQPMVAEEECIGAETECTSCGKNLTVQRPETMRAIEEEQPISDHQAPSQDADSLHADTPPESPPHSILNI